MEILNIGPLEALFVAILVLIILGPKGAADAMRNIGHWIYRLVRSPIWKEFVTTSKEIRDLPNKIVREAGLEESKKELREMGHQLRQPIDDPSRMEAWRNRLEQTRAAQILKSSKDNPAVEKPDHPDVNLKPDRKDDEPQFTE